MPPPTWPVTGLGLAGTPRRPSRPMTTWPSNFAASSSPPDFAVHALSRPPRKKPGPSSQPGPPPELDQQKLRNTRASASPAPFSQHAGGAGPAFLPEHQFGQRLVDLLWSRYVVDATEGLD